MFSQGLTMKIKLIMLTVAMSCAFAGNVMAMTKAEYKTQEAQISADYKASREKCEVMKGNAKDICKAEAKGTEKIAKAELTAQYQPGAKNTEKVALAKADAAYDTAKEKCDDLSGNAKDVCVKDAKAAHVKALEAAKVADARAETNVAPDKKAADVSEARKDANQNVREAEYKAARERCDALSGDVKDKCVADAKRIHGQ
jgi:hypothetical protein